MMQAYKTALFSLLFGALITASLRGSAPDFDQSMQLEKFTAPFAQTGSFGLYNFFKNAYETTKAYKILNNDQKKIPALFHFTWLGGEMPAALRALRDSWLEKHPSAVFIFWTDASKNYSFSDRVCTSFDEVKELLAGNPEPGTRVIVDINKLVFENRAFFDRSLNLDDRSNILRWEVVYRFGGVSVDAGCECLKPFDELNKRYDFYAGLHPLDTGCVRLGMELFAACPSHPILKACVKGVEDNQQDEPGAYKSGSLHFTLSCVKATRQGKCINMIFPASYFYPQGSLEHDLAPDECAKPESYAVYHWKKSSLKSKQSIESNYLISEKPMVVIIPSFNNVLWYDANIDSVLKQKYENYRVIYIDDYSNDGMSDLVASYIKEHDTDNRWVYVRNPRNCGAMFNLYHAIHACPDESIIVTLDGDDWFKDENVLARINLEYADESVWLTYGQFEWWPSGNRGFCCPILEEVRNSPALLRTACGSASHLRTFYAWLFKKIKKEDLLYEGKFFPAAWDRAMMAPMLEMASPNHFRCIDEILYIYNYDNPINDARVAGQMQTKLAEYVYTLPYYQPLDTFNVGN